MIYDYVTTSSIHTPHIFRSVWRVRQWFELKSFRVFRCQFLFLFRKSQVQNFIGSKYSNSSETLRRDSLNLFPFLHTVTTSLGFAKHLAICNRSTFLWASCSSRRNTTSLNRARAGHLWSASWWRCCTWPTLSLGRAWLASSGVGIRRCTLQRSHA